MTIKPFGFLRRKDPSVCSYCKWHMVLEEDNSWSCQNPECRSMSLTMMAIIEATDQAADFDDVLDRGWIWHKPQSS